MTRYAPEVGAMVPPQKAALREVAHITVGPATTNDVVLTDCGAYTLLSLQEPAIIHHVYTMVETAFTAAVDLDIGDSGSANRFNDVATIAATATGAVLIADTMTVPYVYSAAQDILITNANAVAAAGLLHVYVEYSILSD